MDFIPRYNEKAIREDLNRKMVLMAGPRQAGKTTLAKDLIKKSGYSVDKYYMNWDAIEDRENNLQ